MTYEQIQTQVLNGVLHTYIHNYIHNGYIPTHTAKDEWESITLNTNVQNWFRKHWHSLQQINPVLVSQSIAIHPSQALTLMAKATGRAKGQGKAKKSRSGTSGKVMWRRMATRIPSTSEPKPEKKHVGTQTETNKTLSSLDIEGLTSDELKVVIGQLQNRVNLTNAKCMYDSSSSDWYRNRNVRATLSLFYKT